MNNAIQNETRKTTSKDQLAFFKRIENLTAEIAQLLAKNKRLSRAVEMSDNELAKLFFEVQLERGSELSPRELMKIEILNEGAVNFAEHLKSLGGTCKPSQAAAILNCERQTINNRVKANKLISVKSGSQSVLPMFQFDGDKLVDGLEELLGILSDLDEVTKVSFLTSMFFFSDEPDLNVIDVLKKYGSFDNRMAKIRKQAKLFGGQTAH